MAKSKSAAKPNTGAPAPAGAPVSSAASPDGFTNPVLIEQPGAKAAPKFDDQSNPAVTGMIGGVVAPVREPGVAQTTINTDTTTVHPDATITNPVKPTGETAPLKGARSEKKTARKSSTKRDAAKRSVAKRKRSKK